jgi:hypothetical protein
VGNRRLKIEQIIWMHRVADKSGREGDETRVADLPKSKNATTEQTQYIEGVSINCKTMLTTMI